MNINDVGGLFQTLQVGDFIEFIGQGKDFILAKNSCVVMKISRGAKMMVLEKCEPHGAPLVLRTPALRVILCGTEIIGWIYFHGELYGLFPKEST